MSDKPLESVSTGTVWRWKPRNGTGVIRTDDGTLVWFHLSAVPDESVTTIQVGMPVQAEIEHIQQGEFECRAVSVRRII